jgi:hypothetical protein
LNFLLLHVHKFAGCLIALRPGSLAHELIFELSALSSLRPYELLSQLAEATSDGSASYWQHEEAQRRLHGLGFFPRDADVAKIARAFHQTYAPRSRLLAKRVRHPISRGQCR